MKKIFKLGLAVFAFFIFIAQIKADDKLITIVGVNDSVNEKIQTHEEIKNGLFLSLGCTIIICTILIIYKKKKITLSIF